MSRHEIRLRRQKLTAHGADRFRNYGAVLEQHEKEKKVKKIIRVFSLLFIIMIVIMLIVIVTRIERKTKEKTPADTEAYLQPRS